MSRQTAMCDIKNKKEKKNKDKFIYMSRD